MTTFPNFQNNPAGAIPVYVVSGGGGSGSIVALDVATVTTAGTAVTAVAAGHSTGGGFLITSNAAGMYVNQLGAATTTQGGNVVFVPQNSVYNIIPSAGAVSVNSTANSTSLAGYGIIAAT